MKLILVLSVLLASTAIAIPAGTTLSPVVARREENLFKLSKRISGTFHDGEDCPGNEGKAGCVDDKHMVICNHGKWQYIGANDGQMPAGTNCTDGYIA